MKDGLERALDEKTIAERLKEIEEKDKKDNKGSVVEEKTVEKKIKVLTVSASEYVKSMHSYANDDRFLFEYDMVGVIAIGGPKDSFYHGFLCVGDNWQNCPERTEAVVDIRYFEWNGPGWCGTAMIPKKK